MRKLKFLWIFLATALIVAGLIVTFASLARAEFDFGKMIHQSYHMETDTVEGDFSKISADLHIYDVKFELSSDGACRVSRYGDERIVQDIAVTNDTLTITERDTRKWYEKIVSFGEPSVTVYLPKGEYEKLELETDTGDVEISKWLTFDQVTVEGDTGDVHFYAAVKDALFISIHTGDVRVEGVATEGDMRIETTTGDVELYDIACRDLYVVVDTGEMTLQKGGVKGSVFVESDTGDVELKELVAVGELHVDTDTGDVELEACDAGDIDIETDTGDVTATLLTQKSFEVASGTGHVTFPPTTAPNGICKVRSSTGDIEIYVKS